MHMHSFAAVVPVDNRGHAERPDVSGSQVEFTNNPNSRFMNHIAMTLIAQAKHPPNLRAFLSCSHD